MDNEQLIKKLSERTSLVFSKYNRAKDRLEEAEEDKTRAEKFLENTLKAQDLIQQVGQLVQQKAHEQIAKVVSRCLQTVWDDAAEFKIHFERKRGKTDARLVFVTNGYEVEPTDGTAGGEADVASFALQLACVLLQRPAKRRLIVLDETFKMLSAPQQEKVRVLLETLTQELKVQIILVTHSRELITEEAIELHRKADSQAPSTSPDEPPRQKSRARGRKN